MLHSSGLPTHADLCQVCGATELCEHKLNLLSWVHPDDPRCHRFVAEHKTKGDTSEETDSMKTHADQAAKNHKWWSLQRKQLEYDKGGMEQNDEDVGYVLKRRCSQEVRPKPFAKLHKGGDTEISPTQDFRRSSSSVVPEIEPKSEPKIDPEAEFETPCKLEESDEISLSGISPTRDSRRSSSSVVPETEPKTEPKTEPEAESETPCVVPVAETKTEPKIEPEAESETPCQRSLLSVSCRSQMRYLCQSMKK